MENNLYFDEDISKLRKYAQDYNVPIIKDEGLSFLLNTIKLMNAKNVLEIGTAIGYSAIMMARCGANVTSFERDENMYNLAIKNIKNFNLDNKINIIFHDALDGASYLEGKKFDILFIDAAKAQYQKFFDIYTPFLSDNGVIICDNMYFHGLLDKPQEELSRSLRGMMRKLNAFHEYLLNNDDYDTSIYNNIGDGISISIKRNK
jgi:predicted O-methyltransferase YrrM